MNADTQYDFGSFALFVPNGPLFRNNEPVVLQRKTLAVLVTLLRHAGSTMSRESMLNTAWPGTIVSDCTLEYQIRMLRKALGDHARHPAYIETVHGIGFRFIAPVHEITDSTGLPPLASTTTHAPPDSEIINLAVLEASFAQMMAGSRQVVLIKSRAGDGGNSLIRKFLQRIDIASTYHGTSYCAQGPAPTADFRTVLGVLHNLCENDTTGTARRIFAEYAPSAIMRMPAASIRSRTSSETQTPEHALTRELRDLARALEALAAERPLLLLLEDLHRCDRASCALLTLMIRRNYGARIMIIATRHPGRSAPDPGSVEWLHRRSMHGRFTEISLISSHALTVNGYEVW